MATLMTSDARADGSSAATRIVLDCEELTTREINGALRTMKAGSRVTIANPSGRHNLAVGLFEHLDILIDGHAGYFIGGLGSGPDITVNGFVGWSVGENLMAGTIRVTGGASECAGASSHGGTVIIHGSASSRAGISLKGGTIVVGGDVGHMSGFMAQAGTMLVGGDAGHALGDSLYEAVIYVAGSISSLGSDAQLEDLTQSDVDTVRRLVDEAGFTHVSPEDVKRVASAKQLYNFDALKGQEY
ncbi:MAG: GXGXG motif-containing protein [Nocardioidaceae bacterium]